MIVFTASQVLEYLYCPRFTWFEEVMGIPQNQELRFKVLKGREVHHRKDRHNRAYIRKRQGVIKTERNVYLGAPGLPFRGVVDEILIFQDNKMAPLDWKFAEYKEQLFRTYKTQAVIYAKLIREIYGAVVDQAFLIFTRSQNKLVTLAITPDDYARLDTIHAGLTAIMAGNYPGATRYRRRCNDCCYRNICPR